MTEHTVTQEDIGDGRERIVETWPDGRERIVETWPNGRRSELHYQHGKLHDPEPGKAAIVVTRPDGSRLEWHWQHGEFVRSVRIKPEEADDD